ncbi:MAG: hypothetical protein M0T74_02470, partial [Desulfitobacterium hafniense]|nr:hypothetical protein [Desulfitobacterium hafniense]
MDPAGRFERESLCNDYSERSNKEQKFLQAILTSFPAQIRIFDLQGELFFNNSSGNDRVLVPEELVSSTEKKTIVNVTEDKNRVITQTNIIHEGEFLGILEMYWHPKELEKALSYLDSYTNLALDLKAVFETSYDVIYVSDGNGVTLRVSSACE